jgi:hypothetical protein
VKSYVDQATDCGRRMLNERSGRMRSVLTKRFERVVAKLTSGEIDLVIARLAAEFPKFAAEWAHGREVEVAKASGALTWSCHVCHHERADDKISVFSRQREIGESRIVMTENVRYCNDSVDCKRGARKIHFTSI